MYSMIYFEISIVTRRKGCVTRRKGVATRRKGVAIVPTRSGSMVQTGHGK